MKRYDIDVQYTDKSFVFNLDYGTQRNTCFIVSEDDNCYIEYGIYENDPEINIRKKDLKKELLIPILGEENCLLNKDSLLFEVKDSYKKAKEFINNSNLKLEEGNTMDDNDLDFVYRTVYNEAFNTISYYIKSDSFDDEYGIIVYNDDDVLPVISTKYLTGTLTKESKIKRIDAIKEFIFIILNKKVTFHKKGNIMIGKCDGIFNEAISNNKKTSEIEFTNDLGDTFTYSEGKKSSIPRI